MPYITDLLLRNQVRELQIYVWTTEKIKLQKNEGRNGIEIKERKMHEEKSKKIEALNIKDK